MDIKKFREHVRNMVSKRVYESIGEVNYAEIANDFQTDVENAGGFEIEFNTIHHEDGDGFFCGKRFSYTVGFYITEKPYVAYTEGDNYNTPYYDIIKGKLEFELTDGTVFDYESGKSICPFSKIVPYIDGGWETVKSWFNFDEDELIEDEDSIQELDEITQRKKKIIKQQSINAIKGAEDNVKTFLIITGENPMGEKGSNRLNRNANAELVNYLKQGNYAWQPVRGKYGTTENSKIIFNIALDDAKILALRLKQESFIYGKKEDGKTRFELYVINDEHKGYDFVESQQQYDKIGKEEKDFYTAIDKEHKFSVPFEYFNEACENFNRTINETKFKSEKYNRVFTKHLNECLKENMTGKHYYLYRTMLYGGLFG